MSTGQSNRSLRKKGFTLIEALLAAAIVGITGYVLAVSFNNGQMALLNWEFDSELGQFQRWAVDQIDFDSLDLDTLEEGDDGISSPEGHKMSWYGTARPTQVLDVFVVELQCTVMGPGGVYEDFVERRIVKNEAFYENEEFREQLVENKEELFEDLQEARERL